MQALLGQLQLLASLAAELVALVRLDPNVAAPLVRMLLTSLVVEGLPEFQGKAVGGWRCCWGRGGAAGGLQGGCFGPLALQAAAACTGQLAHPPTHPPTHTPPPPPPPPPPPRPPAPAALLVSIFAHDPGARQALLDELLTSTLAGLSTAKSPPRQCPVQGEGGAAIQMFSALVIQLVQVRRRPHPLGLLLLLLLLLLLRLVLRLGLRLVLRLQRPRCCAMPWLRCAPSPARRRRRPRRARRGCPLPAPPPPT